MMPATTSPRQMSRGADHSPDDLQQSRGEAAEQAELGRLCKKLGRRYAR